MLTVVPIIVVSVGAVTLGAVTRRPDGQVAAGVHVGALNLGGKSPEAARIALERWAAQRQSVTFTLRFARETGIKRVWKPSAHTLGLGVDVQATGDAAGKAGHESALGQISNWVSGGKDVPVTPQATVNVARLRTYLQRIARRVNRPARNARLLLLPGGGFGIHHEKPGFGLDLDASATAIVQAWSKFDTIPDSTTPAGTQESQNPETIQNPKSEIQNPNAQNSPSAAATKGPDVTLAIRAVQAAITAADLKQVNGELGSFSTHFGGTGLSRGSNIALAADRINGTLLRPGGIFSYNKVVGPRIGSAGFKTAPVIVHGELVPGLGGGVCQVSSTLYNAVLLSDLKIVHRSHHAFPVHYLPAGRDATVVDGAIDLQFQNNTPAPIYIAASARHGRLSFRILGKHTPGREVSIELSHHTVQPAPTETHSDPTLPAGRRVIEDKGHRGHRVTVYRVVRQNGQLVQRELISHDHYRPFPTVIVIGTGHRAAHTHKAPPLKVPASKAVPASPTPSSPPNLTPDPSPERRGE